MASTEAFNNALKTFLDELSSVFPEEVQLKMFLASFDAVVAMQPQGPMDMFMQALSPYASLVTNRDPALFDSVAFPGAELGRLWKQDLSAQTREAVWDHLNLLLLLGTIIKSMPPELLAGVETMAQSCIEQMQKNGGQLDLGSLFGMVQNQGFGALSGLLSADADGAEHDTSSGSGQPATQGAKSRRKMPARQQQQHRSQQR